MRATLVFIGLAWASASEPPALAQEEVLESDGATPLADQLLSQLEEPPRLAAAVALARRAFDLDPATARAVARGLAARGGHAAAQALLELARHRDPAVRFAALQGISEVALRRADGIESVRAALLDTNADVRGVAYLALARVGDVSDVPVLLEAFASEDPRTRSAADRALSTLSGISIAHDDAIGWSDWWRSNRTVIPERLGAALRRLDLGGDRADLRDARHLLAQYAWFDVDELQETARDWLRSGDGRHRSEGYRIAAECRLGELADDVRRAARDELDPDLLFVALCSAKVLGVDVDGFSLPVTVSDVAALLEDDDEVTVAEAAAGADRSRFLQDRIRQSEERLAAAANPHAPGSFSGGGLGGGAVWLDLDAGRQRARHSEAKPAAADLRPAPLVSARSLGWIGYPLIAVAIGLALCHALRRRTRGDAAYDQFAWETLPVIPGSTLDDAPVESELARTLRSVSLDPECLATSGVRAREVAAVVSGASRWLAQNSMKLRVLVARESIARSRRSRLEGMVSCGMATPEEAAWFEQADAECAALRPELAAAHDELFDMATATLSTESKATLARIRANESGRLLPAPYLVVERSDDDCARLADALAREAAVMRKRNGELEKAVKIYLQGARADLAVWHAQHDLNELFEDVASTWESEVATAAAAAAARFARDIERVDAAVAAKMNSSKPD